MLKEQEKYKGEGGAPDVVLKCRRGQAFYNVSPFTSPGFLADQKHVRQNLTAYLIDFSGEAREVFERFKFPERVREMDDRSVDVAGPHHFPATPPRHIRAHQCLEHLPVGREAQMQELVHDDVILETPIGVDEI